MIGAVVARSKSASYNENSLETKLKKVEKLILNAVSKGEFECCFNENEVFMDKNLANKIKEFGYKLESYSQYNETIYRISW